MLIDLVRELLVHVTVLIGELVLASTSTVRESIDVRYDERSHLHSSNVSLFCHLTFCTMSPSDCLSLLLYAYIRVV